MTTEIKCAGHALYYWTALALLVFAVIAFGLNTAIDTGKLDRYTLPVIAHAATMIAWLALFARQAWAAKEGKLQSHRRLGRWSPLVAMAMVATGLGISWAMAQETGDYLIFVGNSAMFCMFVPLYLAAILLAQNHNMLAHRQAMLTGTLALMSPPISRLFDVLGLSDGVTFLTSLTLLLVLPLLYDWITRRKIAGSTLLMLGWAIAVIGAGAFTLQAIGA